MGYETFEKLSNGEPVFKVLVPKKPDSETAGVELQRLMLLSTKSKVCWPFLQILIINIKYIEHCCM